VHDGANGTNATPAVVLHKSLQTKITKMVVNRTKHTATFRFKGSGGHGKLSFQCKIDKSKWASCRSLRPIKVKSGKHLFQVRAKDSTGKVDKTPAKKWFRL
jgi:hypothetical protein